VQGLMICFKKAKKLLLTQEWELRLYLWKIRFAQLPSTITTIIYFKYIYI